MRWLKKNTAYNSNGDAVISRNDSWFYEDEWDADYKELMTRLNQCQTCGFTHST